MRIFCASPQIFGRGHACELLELVDQVCLVVVAAGHSDIRPIQRRVDPGRVALELPAFQLHGEAVNRLSFPDATAADNC